MGYGFVKAAALAPKIRVADTGHNAQEIIRLMKEAWEKGARILVSIVRLDIDRHGHFLFVHTIKKIL